eukprot:TRINITY_DN45264_c0_g1_i1.p1 TRINITY_DN45264_c0_g1~~TRINITY_DN45264_c0_g1_i1.p1  ORF type:complete len:644 (-),score=53.05 TRINITY_DN45264_c0_g1_i1:575-2506(-)
MMGDATWCFKGLPDQHRFMNFCCSLLHLSSDHWMVKEHWKNCWEDYTNPVACCSGAVLYRFDHLNASEALEGTSDDDWLHVLVRSLTRSVGFEARSEHESLPFSASFKLAEICGSVADEAPCFLRYAAVSHEEVSKHKPEFHLTRSVPEFIHGLLERQLFIRESPDPDVLQDRWDLTYRWLKDNSKQIMSWKWSDFMLSDCPIFVAFHELARPNGYFRKTSCGEQKEEPHARALRSWAMSSWGLNAGVDSFADGVPVLLDAAGNWNSWAADEVLCPMGRVTLLLGMARLLGMQMVRLASRESADFAARQRRARTLVLQVVDAAHAVLQDRDDAVEWLLHGGWPVLFLLRRLFEDLVVLRWHNQRFQQSSLSNCSLASSTLCQLSLSERGAADGSERETHEADWFEFTGRAQLYSDSLRSQLLRVLTYSHHILQGNGTMRVLDIGSGPASMLGPPGVWPLSNDASDGHNFSLEVTAVDPAADEYSKLTEDEDAVRPVKGGGEGLTDVFGHEAFDLIWLSNALDHSLQPISTLREVALLLRPSRGAVLLHCRNEGLRKRYNGLHQWNVDVYRDRMVVWGPDGSHWDIGQTLQALGITVRARVMTTSNCVKVCTLLWRGSLSDAPDWQDSHCQPISDLYDSGGPAD